MKKIYIVATLFFFSTLTINAQDNVKSSESIEVTKECSSAENKTEGICAKTGKTCEKSCENKKTKTCCNGKKVNGFNFGKSNNYSKETSSCTKKTTNKSCCKSKKQNTNNVSACAKTKKSCSKTSTCCKK